MLDYHPRSATHPWPEQQTRRPAHDIVVHGAAPTMTQICVGGQEQDHTR